MSNTIAARGSVWITAYTLVDNDEIKIDWPDEPSESEWRSRGRSGLKDRGWRRPVVALTQPDWNQTGLPREPVITDEIGEVCRLTDYLHQLMGELHWDHTSHVFEPEVAGPITDAPRIQVLVPALPGDGGGEPRWSYYPGLRDQGDQGVGGTQA
ncbi:hypothetical protein A5731_22755 [Mycolicibacterium conceptionense]|uniref:Uncharacterized protein n=1 Tax=Mycolicibacterium conceptionense TaxID=451644 RepID=A0A1A2V2Y1_9MYCO|nr:MULTISPECIES: hypothetical protein [Mycolicibacterium]MCW1820799.1 hypothetical protein [Mycolicibacterium senegalense]OBB10704.1 hypothetical protein A5718_07785 [Mycolicibacterium conceptionense]OBE98518.1 hypothetical protein A5731_22755 [Mycolicibacterium conceptionense]OBF15049.1 hypothetical protein A5726_22995 [Mycolicibacterium conceptionense]OBF30618.1 hypothetical protein A5720_29690 [Mycolicibacterium conceptionense]